MQQKTLQSYNKVKAPNVEEQANLINKTQKIAPKEMNYTPLSLYLQQQMMKMLMKQALLELGKRTQRNSDSPP